MPRSRAKKKRTAPKQLIGAVTRRRKIATWFDTLDAEDQTYVREVVAAMRSGDATPNAVATALVKELGLSKSICTVAATLRSMIHEQA